ncbi:MAG: thiamine phosphate synthase [Porcipelethomonas sp.]
MKFDAGQLLLYGITDRCWTGKMTLYQQVEQALKGGVTILQLREKNLDEQEFTAEAKELAALCHSYNVPLIINDNLNVALQSGADGVHVGQNDMSVDMIRKTAGSDFIIGATAKTVEQAAEAEKMGADYIGVGAVFPSATKKNAVRITKAQLMEICSSVSIPAVAIGGISLENAHEISGTGVKGIAVVSAIFGAADIEHETAKLLIESGKVTQI